MMLRRWALAVATALCGAGTGAAALPDSLSDAVDGATCDYFNRGAGGLWHRRGGDWLDADGKAYGDTPFGSAAVADGNPRAPVQIEVTALVADWLGKRRDPAYGMLVRSVGPRQGISDLGSRESPDRSLRPTLTLQFADGSRRVLDAMADTYLDCTTENGLGAEGRLKAGREYNAVLRFELPVDLGASKLVRATVALAVLKQYGESALGAFAVAPPPSPDAAPKPGLAAGFDGDRGIERHPDVYFATGFEGSLWQTEWTDYDLRSAASTVERDDERMFQPFRGKALRVKLAKGVNLGLDLRYEFRKKGGVEPDEAYFRYYLRFASDWAPDLDGGKLPGFAGTYGRAGWGMRRSTGADGWSMRGGFFVQPTKANPYRNRTAIGTYAYQVDTADPSGDPWRWPLGRLGSLENNRWYSVEQYFKVNTPGKRDGILRAWIDGKLAFERTGIRVRDVPEIKIEAVWFNVYHGGIAPSPRDMHLYIDNVVVSKSYIGPAKGSP